MNDNPRPFRFTWLLGLVLLAASAAGAGWMLHSPSTEGELKTNEPGSAIPEPGTAAVSFGLGDVESGVTSVSPPQPGRVVQVFAKENDEVKLGQPLLQMDDRQVRWQQKKAEIAVNAAKAQLAIAQKGPAVQKSNLAQQTSAIHAAEGRLESAKQEEASLQKFFKAGAPGINEEKVRAAQEAIKSLQAALEAEQEKLESLRLKDPTLDIQLAEEEVHAKEAQLEEAKLAVDECILKAPGAGTILRSLARAGDVFGPQSRQPAFQFCPKEPRIVRAEIEQEYANRIAVGQMAIIEDDTTAGSRWTGHVTWIAPWFAPRRTLTQELFQFNDVRTLEFHISIDPGQPPLRINQRVRVTTGKDGR